MKLHHTVTKFFFLKKNCMILWVSTRVLETSKLSHLAYIFKCTLTDQVKLWSVRIPTIAILVAGRLYKCCI